MLLSDEERQRRRDRIQQVKPWLKSTGPRTSAGKAVSSLNAMSHGLHSRFGLVRECARAAQIERKVRRELSDIKNIVKVRRDRNQPVPIALAQVCESLQGLEAPSVFSCNHDEEIATDKVAARLRVMLANLRKHY